MKKIILPVIAHFVVLGLMASNFVSGVAAEELTVKTSNGFSYLSGGFGEDERERLRNITVGDNLELSFALQSKNYLAGANVLIKDARETMSSKQFPRDLCFLWIYRQEATPSRRRQWEKL